MVFEVSDTDSKTSHSPLIHLGAHMASTQVRAEHLRALDEERLSHLCSRGTHAGGRRIRDDTTRTKDELIEVLVEMNLTYGDLDFEDLEAILRATGRIFRGGTKHELIMMLILNANVTVRGTKRKALNLPAYSSLDAKSSLLADSAPSSDVAAEARSSTDADHTALDEASSLEGASTEQSSTAGTTGEFSNAS
jgi:hypothetical protein